MASGEASAWDSWPEELGTTVSAAPSDDLTGTGGDAGAIRWLLFKA